MKGNQLARLLLPSALILCAALAWADDRNLQPKYGSLPKANWQKAADEKFISGMDEDYHGDRKKASDDMAVRGWQYLRAGNHQKLRSLLAVKSTFRLTMQVQSQLRALNDGTRAWSGEGIVHGRDHHRLPVISVVELLFAYRSTLSRAVEGQTVIAAPDCRGATEIEQLFETRIQAAVED